LIQTLTDRQLLGGLTEEARTEAMAHVANCRGCGQEFEAAQWQRAALRSMKSAPVPAMLAANLRVMASHERQRQLSRITWRARYEAIRDRVVLEFENMMKPLAFPVAGGLISAFMMFGVIVPSVTYARVRGIEPPSQLFTEPDGRVVGEGDLPRLESANQPNYDGRVVLLLVIDPHGRVDDFIVKQGILTDEMKTFILFSTFTPATMFGKPSMGAVQAIFGGGVDENGAPQVVFVHS
jgi:hypothetical protein